MDTSTLTRIDNAVRADFSYLRAIRDESGANEANTAISFYNRFIEAIVNGLNSIYRYHHAEEFVGRFMTRKHIFSLNEKEFEQFAEDLTDEMVLTGNAPSGSLLRERVIPKVISLLKRWYYVLDGIEGKDFKKLRKTIFQIMAYDITSVYIPCNLDKELLYAYSRQFSPPVPAEALLDLYAAELQLPKNFGTYLAFKHIVGDGWDVDENKERLSKYIPSLVKIVGSKRNVVVDVPKTVLQKTIVYASKQYKKDLSLLTVYSTGYETVLKALKEQQAAFQEKNTLVHLAKEIATSLNNIPSFPSQAFAEDSVAQYIYEKLKRWRHLIQQDTYTKTIPLVSHDIVRTFYTQELDTFLLVMAKEQIRTENALFLIVSGWALKFSDKFISYNLFKESFPQWDEFKDLENASTLAPRATRAFYAVKNAYTSVRSLSKNKYAPLMKNFTSFHTVKKLFELFYEGQDEMGSVADRTDEVYREVIRKDESKSTEDKLKDLQTILTKTPKRVNEDQFDEIMYLSIKHEMETAGVKKLGEFVGDKKIREKYQKLVYIRFEAYTFNRIMATNYGGLGNLFGTKGFIILIEAYLIGSGLEHIINYFVAGSVKTFINMGTVINESLLMGSSTVTDVVSDELYHVFDTPVNLSLDSFTRGWEHMDWGRTAMSVVIPIILMFLITSYNYIFFKLNRKSNREKSFQRLTNSTERWLSENAHVVQLFRKREYSIFFELFKVALLLLETVYIIGLLYSIGFEPTQLALFFFLLATICLSAFQGNKLKDEVTLGQSEAISDTIRDFIFIPIIELGKFLGGQAKSINFIPWLVQKGVEPLYKYVTSILQSFISFQREKKEEIL